MVELYSSHPSNLSLEFRRKLASLSFRDRGLLYDYIINPDGDLWEKRDRIFWLERKGQVIAWAVRSDEYPYETPSFMVYVRQKERRKGWATYLYKTATRYCKRKYDVYGSHRLAAANFYEKLGRWDYN